MEITWTPPQKAPFGSTGIEIDVECGILDGVPTEIARFMLYQSPEAAESLPTMWILFDAEAKTQWFLYGEGWGGAREAGKKRILEVLEKD